MRGSSTKPTRERVPAPPRSGVLAVTPRVISLFRLVPHSSKVKRFVGRGQADTGVHLEIGVLIVERNRQVVQSSGTVLVRRLLE